MNTDEDVVDVLRRKGMGLSRSEASIVLETRGRNAKDSIGVVQLGELCRRTVEVLVWMQLSCLSQEGLSHFDLCCVLRDAQHFIVVDAV